jgi:hypothetical protein
MDAEERARIEQICESLVKRLGQLSDRNMKRECSELFSPDGTWIRGGVPYAGRASIMDSFKTSPTEIIRHLATGTVIDVEDGNTARGITYYIVYRHDPKTNEPKLPLALEKPFSLGEWHDKFVKIDGRWLFSRREVKRLFQA